MVHICYSSLIYFTTYTIFTFLTKINFILQTDQWIWKRKQHRRFMDDGHLFEHLVVGSQGNGYGAQIWDLRSFRLWSSHKTRQSRGSCSRKKAGKAKDFSYLIFLETPLILFEIWFWGFLFLGGILNFYRLLFQWETKVTLGILCS